MATTRSRAGYKRPEPARFVSTPQAIGIRDTATYLGICEKSVRRLISEGTLPAVKVRAAWRIKIADIDAMLTPKAS